MAGSYDGSKGQLDQIKFTIYSVDGMPMQLASVFIESEENCPLVSVQPMETIDMVSQQMLGLRCDTNGGPARLFKCDPVTARWVGERIDCTPRDNTCAALITTGDQEVTLSYMSSPVGMTRGFADETQVHVTCSGDITTATVMTCRQGQWSGQSCLEHSHLCPMCRLLTATAFLIVSSIIFVLYCKFKSKSKFQSKPVSCINNIQLVGLEKTNTIYEPLPPPLPLPLTLDLRQDSVLTTCPPEDTYDDVMVMGHPSIVITHPGTHRKASTTCSNVYESMMLQSLT
ncbi:hypothetical protein HDE_09391 [Halotydeus destructor]|nr:hypothetical protein HDE_09391 [Halotydeus destructor]